MKPNIKNEYNTENIDLISFRCNVVDQRYNEMA